MSGSVGLSGLRRWETRRKGTQVAKQTTKQVARRRVQEVLAARHKERVEQERRQAALAVTVLTALAEREEAIATAEATAARAVQALLKEGLQLGDVGELCGRGVAEKELQRLAKLPVAEG